MDLESGRLCPAISIDGQLAEFELPISYIWDVGE